MSKGAFKTQLEDDTPVVLIDVQQPAQGTD